MESKHYHVIVCRTQSVEVVIDAETQEQAVKTALARCEAGTNFWEAPGEVAEGDYQAYCMEEM